MNKSTTTDPQSSEMLRSAYSRGLNVVARIGNPYTVRDHSDDANHTSYTELAAAYGRLVASLPAPPDGSAALHVQVGNELNACNEWHCSASPNISMSSGQMAAEVGKYTYACYYMYACDS